MHRSTLLFPSFLLGLASLLAACGGIADGPASDGAAAPLLPQTSFTLPADGTPNDNGCVGPFCGTGTTLVVHDRAANALGYVYFFGWEGTAYQTSPTTSAASDLEIEVSGASDPTDASSAQVPGTIDFPANELIPGAAASTKAGGLLFTVTIQSATTLQNDGTTYFDMGSVVAKVDVSVE
jgi:hypothetical protein